MPKPMFGDPVGPWLRSFAWFPTWTCDAGWIVLRPVWKRHIHKHHYLDGGADFGGSTGDLAMAKQLREMLTDLRAEIGHSTNVAHGVNDRETLLYYLNRTQIQLYQDYDWPQLMITREIALADGQRYYPYPIDLAFDDISQVSGPPSPIKTISTT